MRTQTQRQRVGEATGDRGERVVGRRASVLPIPSQPPHILLSDWIQPGENRVLPTNLGAGTARQVELGGGVINTVSVADIDQPAVAVAQTDEEVGDMTLRACLTWLRGFS